VNNIGGLRGALRVVDEMAQKGYCFGTYSKLADLSAVPILNAGSAKEQLEEEYYKAKYQKDDEDMAKLINDAEKYTFFKGNIRFLLWNENGEYNKDIGAFNKKYEFAKQVFTENDTFVFMRYRKRGIIPDSDTFAFRKISKMKFFPKTIPCRRFYPKP
jgi:hypothetical protein